MNDQMTRRTLLRTGAFASVASFCNPYSLLHAQNIVASPQGLRQRLLMDFDWKFFQGNANDPGSDLNFGYGQGDFAKSGSFDFAKEAFDDSKWRTVRLPHDWAVALPFIDDAALEGHGFKPLGRRYPGTSVGWYRRTFDIPAEDRGKRLAIEFDGVFRSSLVFLNGFFVGRNDSGYVPFRFDVTDLIRYGAKNTLVVRVDATMGDGWFYEGAGIYRHVWLHKTDALHLAPFESVVRAELHGHAASLSLSTIVQNEGPAHAPDCRVHWRILHPDGHTVATASSAPAMVSPDNEAVFSAEVPLPQPQLWSPQIPLIYTAEVSVECEGRVRDLQTVSFGVRSVRFDPDRGLLLNGMRVKIKGTCNHQDHAGVGVALPDGLQRYRLDVLRRMGCNAVRTSHNMPTPEWVEACDRMGMMMLCETRQMASTPEGLSQLETMIRRYRNSPSIILWSVGNEEWPLQSQRAGTPVVAHMVERAHMLDPTRLCTAASTAPFDNDVTKSLDVQGFNYTLQDIDAFHAKYPHKPCIGTETASTVSTRGIYETDKLRNWVSAYDLNHTDWSELAEQWWKFYAARDWLAGGFAWTGFDYRGEPTPYGWPSINSQFGIVDVCGFAKDNFLYYKAWWSGEPALHLLPHWNWGQRLGEEIAVWVHSNLDEVELFLNGQSHGRRKVEPLTHVEWKVPYEPGVLEARGLRNGAVVLTAKRETTGSSHAVRLSADRTEINADGEDIAILKVEVVDDQGRLVPTASDLISFRITGDGTLLGVGNGDPNCHESDVEPRRSVFNGLAQLIVQSTMKAGTISIEAYTEERSGPGLVPAVLSIRTLTAQPRAAL